MKIRVQDGSRYVDFGDCYITDHGERAAVYINSQYTPVSIVAGVYEDNARARGVLQEIGQAYGEDQRVFYMPVE